MRPDNYNAVASLAQRATALALAIQAAMMIEPAQKSRQSMSETIKVIQRYIALLQDGLVQGSPADALKGANLLTSINRGLNDTVWASVHSPILDRGKEVSDAAIATAKGLRNELGMGF